MGIQTAREVKFTLVLPTEKYLKSFIGSRIKLDPYCLSVKDKLGVFICQTLDKKKFDIELSPERYNDHIKIIIPDFYKNKGKYEFRKGAVEACNLFLRYWFYESFIDHMNLCSLFSIRMDKSIHSFCSINEVQVDIDIQYDTLKKKYYRWRENKGQPIHKYIMELVEN